LRKVTEVRNNLSRPTEDNAILPVRFGALLHDIGKPLCWGLRKSWSHHVDFGFTILENTFGKNLAKIAVSHHTTGAYSDFFHPSTKTEKVISIADHIASGADRPRDEDPEFGGALPSLPVVMSHPLGGKKPIFQVQADELITFTEDFKMRFKDATIDSDTFSKVFNYLSKSVLTRIPADTRFPYNDVSLFDHLRLTCALANCIWTQGYKNLDPSSYSFSIISADADKISRYINRSPRLPDLAAGSRIISLATLEASSIIKQKAGPECVIFEGGGGFFALVPSKHADYFVIEAENAFKKLTHGDATATVTRLDVSGLDIQQNFAETWGKAIKTMHDKKLARDDSIPVIDSDKQICDVCHIRSATKDISRPLLVDTQPSFEHICDTCFERRESGRIGKSIDTISDENGFVAVLKIDGDDMGEIISGKKVSQLGKNPTPSRIATISRLVHESCESELAQIVSSNGGLNIYAGGDDVLAILPGKNVLKTAIQMQQSFTEMMGEQATVSAGISIFDYKLPVYIALESASECLRAAKNNAGKSSISFDILYGLAARRAENQNRVYQWSELKELLELVDFMQTTSSAKRQLRSIVQVSARSKLDAEILIKYTMGRTQGGEPILDWQTGNYLLSRLDKGMLSQALIVYNIVRRKEDK
jgi:hypothetical protein